MTAENPAAPTAPHRLSEVEYRARSDAVLTALEATIDRWLQDDLVDIDSQRTGGLLELSFPDRSQIIVNTQPPLQEIWLAARSGGFHFRWFDGAWRDTRDHSEFFAKISACASLQAGRPLEFKAP